MSDKKNPKVEWGFFAVVPRIVRTDPKYKDVSHTAKWLYTCLKDLCGDRGSCFRALRTLSEETSISTGSLSTMIRELHDVGLIHAEKKARGKGGKEVWHISIVDIWQTNREYCSKYEQHFDGDVQNMNNALPVVQNMNDVVQKMNSIPESCSENERSCSNFDDRRIDSEEQRYEARTGEEERAASSQSNEHAHALEYENNNHSYRHDHTRKEDAWNCENWCRAHEKTCSDYQTWIESGGRETPTEPRVTAIKIGVTDDSPVASYTPVSAPGDTSGSAGIPGDLRPGRRGGRDGVSLETPQQPALRATGATQPQVAIASTPGGAVTPLPAQNPHSLQGPDGATTVAESSEPRASHGKVTQESILDDWDAVQGRKEARDGRLIKAARDGVRASPTREELAGCRDWLPTTDRPGKPWYRLHGVALWDVIEKLGAYRSYLAMSIEPAPLADIKQPKPIDVYTAAALDPERNSIERLKERQQQARLKREAARQQGGAL